MTKYRLAAASCAWLVLMFIVWSLFTPKGLSLGSWILLGLTGPLLLLVVSRLTRSRRPAGIFPS